MLVSSWNSAHDLLPPLQSGFRAGHSTETALLRVLSDILQAVDRGDVAALILLDLSAAFDTVDNDILLQRLQLSFGIDGTAHRWFTTYLTDRSQCVRRGHNMSAVSRLRCGGATRLSTGANFVCSLYSRPHLACGE